MKICILGAGKIGGVLGQKWASKGHEVVFGVRDPQAQKVQNLLQSIEGSVTPAAIDSAVKVDTAVVLLAIPGSAVPATAAALGEQLDGKIVIDATNNINAPVMNSLATLQAHAPKAHFYRAFNHLGWENFADPVIGGETADLFYCGEAGENNLIVNQLIADVGLRPIYAGGLEIAPVVDNLTRLWFLLALQQGYGRHSAFKFLAE